MALRMLPPAVATLDTRAAKPAPKTADPFYQSSAWRDLVDAIKAQRGPYCECPTHDPGRSRRASRLIGDHIVERRDGGAELDPRNIMLMCYSCHTAKTIAARARRMARRSTAAPSSIAQRSTAAGER